MPDCTWKCEACGEQNPPYTEVCRSCNQLATQQDISQLKHENSQPSCFLKMKYHLKKYGWLVGMAFLFDIATFLQINRYLATGEIYMAKEHAILTGDAAIIFLLSLSLIATYCSFLLVNSIIKTFRSYRVPNPSINTDAGDKAAGAGYVKR